MPGNGNGNINDFPELVINGQVVKEMHIDNLSTDKLYVKNSNSFNYGEAKKCIFETADVSTGGIVSGNGFLVKGSDNNIYGITTLKNSSINSNYSSGGLDLEQPIKNYLENKNIKIFLNNEEIECREIGLCDTANIVVLKLLGVDQTKLHYLEFEDYDNIKIGDTVFALGSVAGIDRSTVSKGIVRDPIWSYKYATCENLFHDCDMFDSSSSGHALLNNNGKLIGMHGHQYNLGGDSIYGGPNSTTIKNILENIIQVNSYKNKKFSVMSKLVGKSGVLIYNENNELIYSCNEPQLKVLDLTLSQYIIIEYGNNYVDENDSTKVATRNLVDQENDYFMIAGKRFKPNFNKQYFFNSGVSGLTMDGESLDSEITYINETDLNVSNGILDIDVNTYSIISSFRFYLGIGWFFNMHGSVFNTALNFGDAFYERNYFGKRFVTYNPNGVVDNNNNNLATLLENNWDNQIMEIIPTNKKFQKILNFMEPLEINKDFFISFESFFSYDEYGETSWEAMKYTNDDGEEIHLRELENKRSMLSVINLTMDDLQETRKRLIDSKINNKQDSFLVDITLNIWVNVDYTKLESSPEENPLVHIATRGVNSIRASVTLKNLDLYGLLNKYSINGPATDTRNTITNQYI